MLNKIKQWMNSNPKNDNQETKQNQTIAGVVLMVVFMLGFGLFVYAKKHAAKDIQIDEKEFAGIFDRKFNNSTDEALIEKQNQKLASMNQNIEKLSQEQEKKLLNERERAGLDKTHIESTINQMKERIEALEKENKSAKNKLSQMASKKSTIVRPPSRKEQIQKAQYKRQFNEQRMYQRAPMRHVRFVRKPKVKKKRTSDNYVWAGTQVEGVLVTGILGDAGINGSKNKGNGVIRLIGNGDMPSKKKSHLKL
jgi:conjugal transfer pilus assembly protein TraB